MNKSFVTILSAITLAMFTSLIHAEQPHLGNLLYDLKIRINSCAATPSRAGVSRISFDASHDCRAALGKLNELIHAASTPQTDINDVDIAGLTVLDQAIRARDQATVRSKNKRSGNQASFQRTAILWQEVIRELRKYGAVSPIEEQARLIMQEQKNLARQAAEQAQKLHLQVSTEETSQRQNIEEREAMLRHALFEQQLETLELVTEPTGRLKIEAQEEQERQEFNTQLRGLQNAVNQRQAEFLQLQEERRMLISMIQEELASFIQSGIPIKQAVEALKTRYGNDPEMNSIVKQLAAAFSTQAQTVQQRW